ncbi:MAG: hypothetical protein HKN23_14145, partial [Verrucomicrobiales bacterium]|nr:hypothetical protein [Verrucomicrobiales bacterium]
MKIPRLLLILPLACFTFLPEAKAQLHGGVSAVDITPKVWPVRLVGSFTPHKVDSAHDPLYARAMVISSDKVDVAICVVDNCLIDRKLLDQAKEIVWKKTGIPVKKQLISTTHTHSAPPGRLYDDLSKEELAYQEQLVEGIAEAIINASKAKEPVEVGFGKTELPDEVNNRRWFLNEGMMPVNPFGDPNDQVKMNPSRSPGVLKKVAGPVDPEFAVLMLRDGKKRPLGVLANYALHYVGNVPGRQVSADYFGEFARLMPVRLPNESEKFMAMMSNGTSGDINNIRFTNPRPRREPFEQIRIVASKAADAAYFAMRDIENFSGDDTKLDMRERKIKLDRRKPTDEQVERARAILKMSEDEQKKLPRLATNYAERTLKFIEKPEQYEVKIQT